MKRQWKIKWLHSKEVETVEVSQVEGGWGFQSEAWLPGWITARTLDILASHITGFLGGKIISRGKSKLEAQS